MNEGVTGEALPRLADDVGVWLFFERYTETEDLYIVGSRKADRYLAVPESKLPVVRAFMQRLNGERSLDEIEKELTGEDRLRGDIRGLYRKFYRAGLLAEATAERGDIERMSIILSRVSIGGLLRFLSRFSRLAKPTAAAGLCLIAAAAFVLLLDPGLRSLAVNPIGAGRSLLGILASFAAVGVTSILAHELSHCFAAASLGILNGTVRVQLYWGIFPIVGLKLAGLYTVSARGRLAVWSAGVLANFSIASASLLAIGWGGANSASVQAAVTVNWLMGVINLMPLVATDGYFLLTTLMKEPNVRVRAWNWLCRPLGAGSRRPPLVVMAYLLVTVWLLVSTIWNHAARLLNAAGSYRESALSGLLLIFCAMTLWRRFRANREEDR